MIDMSTGEYEPQCIHTENQKNKTLPLPFPYHFNI